NSKTQGGGTLAVSAKACFSPGLALNSSWTRVDSNPRQVRSEFKPAARTLLLPAALWRPQADNQVFIPVFNEGTKKKALLKSRLYNLS
ncbi:MAG: hypothetical protein PHG34_00555, partial [Candidatus Cloacimonetes bacterium]|nr:hypothetical protein [Candidatus Cloacimonadota bacterium]